MKITLYKNCILNNKYQNVLSTKTITGQTTSILDTYLNSLTKLELTLNNIYYENDMEIVIDYDLITRELLIIRTDNIYDFNYAKIEEINGTSVLQPDLVRYCFIKHIEIKNGCVYIETEEDIFSSFFNKVSNTQTCNLISSRLCHYGNKILTYRKLPLPYDGNNILSINSIGTNTKCKIICEIQTYLMDDEVNYNARRSHLCVVEGSIYDTIQATYVWKKSYTKYELYTIIKELLSQVGTGHKMITTGHYGQGSGYRNEYFYEIGNIYIIPDTFNITSLYTSCLSQQEVIEANVNFSNSTLELLSTGGTSYPPVLVFDKLKDDYKNQLITVHSDYLENDFSIVSIGTFGTQIPVEPNGTDIDYRFTISYDDMNIAIQFNCANKVIDVSKDFLYVQHYNLVSSDITIQRKIELAITSLNYDKNILSLKDSELNYAFGAVKNLVGIGNAVASENVPSGISNAISIGENAGHAYYNEELQNKISLQKNIFNQPHYCNSKGNFITSNSFLSYFTPIYEMHITADNLNYIKDTINTLGYSVFEYTNTTNGVSFNALFDCDNAITLNAKYDYLRFAFPNVYGKFTNDIAKKLNDILSSGIKIWYDTSLIEDNYHIDNLT